jgi:predicted membrane protein
VIEVTERRRVIKVLAAVLVIDVAYWVAWYADRSLVASNTRSAYYEFENAFPLADGWLALCCVGALFALRRRSATALMWLLLAAGGGIYLFCMDALYDLEKGIWWSSGAGGVIELVINLITLGVSGWFLRWTWQHREGLLAGS